MSFCHSLIDCSARLPHQSKHSNHFFLMHFHGSCKQGSLLAERSENGMKEDWRGRRKDGMEEDRNSKVKLYWRSAAEFWGLKKKWLLRGMESMEDRDGRRERGSRLATRLFRGWESQGLSCPFQSDTDRSPFAELFSSVYWCKWREMAWFREWQFVPFNQQTPSLPLLSYFSGDVCKWIRDQGDCHDRPCWHDDQRVFF